MSIPSFLLFLPLFPLFFSSSLPLSCPSFLPLLLPILFSSSFPLPLLSLSLPQQSAKVMFVIREPLIRRESGSAKKMPKFLYWGLTTVFDHQ